MPVGDQESQQLQVASEQVAQGELEREERGRVEAGRESWAGEGVGGSSRRKRRVKTRAREDEMIQAAQQFYRLDEALEGGETNLTQQHTELQHNVVASKRQRLDDCDHMLPLEAKDQRHVYADETAPDGHHSDDVMAGSHHGNAMPDDHHGNLDPHSEEDIEAVLRSKQAEVTDLIAKCGEMLSESVAYEAFFPVRIDELLRTAQSLEDSLLQEKQAMRERLQAILGML